MILSLEQNYGATDKQCIYTYILLAEGKKKQLQARFYNCVSMCVHTCTAIFKRTIFNIRC